MRRFVGHAEKNGDDGNEDGPVSGPQDKAEKKNERADADEDDGIDAVTIYKPDERIEFEEAAPQSSAGVCVAVAKFAPTLLAAFGGRSGRRVVCATWENRC